LKRLRTSQIVFHFSNPFIDLAFSEAVRPQKPLKIDLNQEYLCPCRRRGCLKPIALTEAFGCDRCQQIFVLDESGQVIEQLSSSYPYKRAWRWTGHRWVLIRPGFAHSYLPLITGMAFFLLSSWLLIILHYPSSLGMILGIVIAALLITLVATLFWIVYRR
jgi:hypothetical protein